jgi:hypothetical protein
MSNCRDVLFDVKSDDRGSHHGEPGVLLGHLVNRGVSPLDSELHQVFNVGALDLVTKSFVENFYCCLRCDFTSLGSAYAISDCEDVAFTVCEERVFIEGPLGIEPPVRYGCRHDPHLLRIVFRLAHSTASNLSSDSGVSG